MRVTKREKKKDFSFFTILFSLLLLSAIAYASFNKEGNIVTDSSTGLQWQDDAIGTTVTMEWTNAITHCEDLELDGHGDWRLPNLAELTSLVDDTRVDPSIDSSVFDHTASNGYWSSTTDAGNSDYAWFVGFGSGYQSGNYKTYSFYVRCVRAGQFDLLPFARVSFISELPQDNTLQLEPFTKEWTFGADLTDYSVEVLGSNFSSYGAVSISGNRVSVDLVPDVSTVINTITLKLKDPDGGDVKIGNSETFWATVRTGYAPRLTDEQNRQMTGALGETISMLVETFDGDGDTVSLSVKNSDGGTVSFTGNRLDAAFSDSQAVHTITITLSDGKESVDVDITVLRFDSSTIQTFYNDVDPNNHDHHFP